MNTIEIAARLARDSAFDCVKKHEHGFGFTAIHNRGATPLLLFVLDRTFGHPLTWELRADPVTREFAAGHGLASLAATLIGMALLQPPMDAAWRAAKAVGLVA
jgi:hypothetical protein